VRVGTVARALLAAIAASACRPSSPGTEGSAAGERASTSPTPAGAAGVSEPEPAPAPETAPETELHGELDQIDGQRVLRLWGTPREMGFAHGALLRREILALVEGYALGVVPGATLDAAGPLYDGVAKIAPELREEAEGIVAGMQANGGARIEALGRDLSARDLLVLNAMTDLLSIGCSSVSAWGPATADDDRLSGAPAIVRNLDWSDDDDLLRQQLVIAYAPSDPERQEVVSIAFAGYIGCLSCMNEGGVTALFNMGYGDGAADLSTAVQGFAPANLLLRDVMSRRDVDGDGTSTGDDVEAGLRAASHAGSWILHVVEGRREGVGAPARVLEVEADGVVRRDPDDALGQDMLGATNHLREKARPRACSRWNTIERRTASRTIDRDAMWSLAVDIRLETVVHTILAEPETRRLAVWLRGPGDRPHAETKPVVHEWPRLFARER
jgi:hypothetical protein